MIAHVVYYGPVIWLLVLLIKPTSRIIARYGLGFSLLVIGSRSLSINSESRQLIVSFPFIVLFAVKATEELIVE